MIENPYLADPSLKPELEEAVILNDMTAEFIGTDYSFPMSDKL